MGTGEHQPCVTEIEQAPHDRHHRKEVLPPAVDARPLTEAGLVDGNRYPQLLDHLRPRGETVDSFGTGNPDQFGGHLVRPCCRGEPLLAHDCSIRSRSSSLRTRPHPVAQAAPQRPERTRSRHAQAHCGSGPRHLTMMVTSELRSRYLVVAARVRAPDKTTRRFRQWAPTPSSTALGVRASSVRFCCGDQASRKRRSNSMRSSSPTDERPSTCHNPVRPGVCCLYSSWS